MAITSVIESMRTNLANAYASIEAKGATMPENKNLENLAATIDSVTGGGSGEGGNGDAVINGLIKSYYAYAGENINAGDFVKFVEGVAGKGELVEGEVVLTQAHQVGNSHYMGPSTIYQKTIKIDESRALLIWNDNSSNNMAYVVQIIDGVITFGPQFNIGKSFCDFRVFANSRLLITHIGAASLTADSVCATLYRVDGTNLVTLSTLDSKYGAPKLLELNETDYFCFSGSYAYIIRLENDVLSYPDDRVVKTTKSYGKKFLFRLSNGNIIATSGFGAAVAFELYDDKILVASELINNLPTASETIYNIYYVFKISDNKFLYITPFSYEDATETPDKEYDYYCGYEYQIGTFNNDNTFTLDSEEPLKLYSYYCDDIEDEDGNYEFDGIAYGYAAAINPDTGHLIMIICKYHAVYADEETRTSKVCGLVFQINEDYTLTLLNESENIITQNIGLTDDIFQPVGDKNLFQKPGIDFAYGLDGSGNFFVYYDDESKKLNQYVSGETKKVAMMQCLHETTDNRIVEGYYTGGQNVTYETQVKKATSAPFYGVAKTAGVGGDETAHNEQIEIYTL